MRAERTPKLIHQFHWYQEAEMRMLTSNPLDVPGREITVLSF